MAPRKNTKDKGKGKASPGPTLRTTREYANGAAQITLKLPRLAKDGEYNYEYICMQSTHGGIF
jgi:hypothetical protein